jgi:hypothetical protein
MLLVIVALVSMVLGILAMIAGILFLAFQLAKRLDSPSRR